MKSNWIFYIALFFLATYCAKITQPTGGPKDEQPPVLERSNPPDRQINFNKNEIELIFDEAIQINNAREQIIITPSIGKKFEMQARKNKAILKFNADLLENTTYTLSFRESIQDLTERNPVVNLKLAFSTGSYIDSLSIRGNVYDLLKGVPVKNYTVAAAPYHDTLSIFKHAAQWITLTNDKGEYSLENLKAGEYLVYAFNDKNKNLIVDSKSEPYGFIAKPVELQESISDLAIPAIKLDARELKLISARPIATYFSIRTTKGLSEYQLTSEVPDQTIHSIPEDEATIKVYNTLVGADSIPVRFQAKDSIENLIDTIFYIKFDARSVSKERFTAKIEECNFLENKSLLKASFNFSKPVQTTNYDSILIHLDSVNFIGFTADDFTWKERNTLAVLEKKMDKEIDFTKQPAATPTTRISRDERPKPADQKSEEPKKLFNQLLAPIGAFISIENDTAASMTSTIKTIKPDNSGVIIVEVHSHENVIIQLLSKSHQIIQHSNQHKARFENLNPGEYLIRVIVDKNNNGKWDSGNYFRKLEPEPVMYYMNEKGTQIVNIKANWEFGPLFITPEIVVDK